MQNEALRAAAAASIQATVMQDSSTQKHMQCTERTATQSRAHTPPDNQRLTSQLITAAAAEQMMCAGHTNGTAQKRAAHQNGGQPAAALAPSLQHTASGKGRHCFYPCQICTVYLPTNLDANTFLSTNTDWFRHQHQHQVVGSSDKHSQNLCKDRRILKH
jgi:hypothetical protein